MELDTPNTLYRVPPLTLQPILENAVKHGLNPNLEPLYISIVTEYIERGIRIIVEDTAPGYAPSDAPGFALNNIRERLKTMRGDAPDIEQREADGTGATIFPPK